MNTHAAHVETAASSSFAFLQKLATDLSGGRIELPAFPEVVARVRRALQDDNASVETLRLLIGAEPALALRLMQIANSAAINTTGRPITDLRTAITRLGFNLVRTSSISFAMAQMARNEALKPIRVPLNKLWQRSALVAAMGHVLARHVGTVNSDTAALAGMLHGVGKLYILVNGASHPGLFTDPETYRNIEAQWHTEIAKALLENWQMSEDVVAAVHLQGDLDYAHEGDPDLTDVMVLAERLVSYGEQAPGTQLALESVRPALHINLSTEEIKDLLVDWDKEMSALKIALAG